MSACPAFDPTGAFVSTVLRWLDCQVIAFGTNGLSAFGPESPYSGAWTGLLILVVALFGYRLILSGTIALRESMLIMVKIGVVLSLAGQWPAYRTLVYDVFTAAPASMATDLVEQTDIASVNVYRLAYRVDRASSVIADLSALPAQSAAVPTESEDTTAQPSEALSDTDKAHIRWADTFLVVSTLGGLLSVRLISGILLGLGPIFIAFLLFPVTQGLFVGWLRVLIAATFGAIAASVVVSIGLAITEPQLAALDNLVRQGQQVGTLPTTIFSTALLCVVLMLAVLTAMARLTSVWGPQVLVSVTRIFEDREPARQKDTKGETQSNFSGPALLQQTPQFNGRVHSTSDALRALDQRDEQAGSAQIRMIKVRETPLAGNEMNQALRPLPLGQSSRRTVPRKSATADRRDGMK